MGFIPNSNQGTCSDFFFSFHPVPRSCQPRHPINTRFSEPVQERGSSLVVGKRTVSTGAKQQLGVGKPLPARPQFPPKQARLAPSSPCPQGFQKFCPFWPKTTLRLFTKHSHPHPSLPLDPQPASLEPGLHRAGHMNSGFLWCDGSLRSLCERRF